MKHICNIRLVNLKAKFGSGNILYQTNMALNIEFL